jgi:hypothetical protein
MLLQQIALPELHGMSSRLIQCLLQVQLPQPKHFYILPQLEVAVLQKQPKVLMKVMNVPTVVHVMEKVVYAHVTKVTRANHAKHKQFWFKFAKKTSLNSKQKRNGIFTFKDHCIYIYTHTYNKVDFKM